MADLRIVDAPEIPTEDITGQEKLPTGGSGNYSITLDSVADYTKTKKDLADNTSVDGKVNGVRQELDAHVEDLLNPHQVTKGQIGLGNVDNTADADKPVSNSTQSAIISAVTPKANKTYVDDQLALKANKTDVYTKAETYTKQESNDLVNNSISTALTPINTSLDLAKRGVINRYDPLLTYNSGERVVLNNGDIVKGIIDGNANDPNTDLTGWVKVNSASQIFDESGLNQHQINTSNARLTGNVLDYFTKSELEAWEADQENFDASDAIIRAQIMSKSNEITFPTGTFRLTKQIPSSKSWCGVKGSFQTRGTKIIVDSVTPISPLIVQTFGGIEVHDIYFTAKQDKTHTIYKDNGYICKHSGLRVEKFNIGFDVSGTYDYFEDCEFWRNTIGVKARAVRKSVEGSVYTQSTMFGFNRCQFIYNDIGFDTSPNYSVGTDEDLINVPFIECGFELNNIGINSPQRTWYVTLLNCWFEANTTWGLNAPTSHVVEINTRHNSNSPKNVSPTTHSQILAMTANFSEVTARVFSADAVSKGLKFSNYYQPNGNSEFKGETLSQRFTDDSGGATATIQFVREGAGSISGGSAIAFSTTSTSNMGQLVEQWRIDRKGDLKGKSGAAIYTTKIMYTNTVGDFAGSGSPEGVVVASTGSTYRRTDGNTPCFYVKESGVGSTGWVGK